MPMASNGHVKNHLDKSTDGAVSLVAIEAPVVAVEADDHHPS
jgi:hypothetical protein